MPPAARLSLVIRETVTTAGGIGDFSLSQGESCVRVGDQSGLPRGQPDGGQRLWQKSSPNNAPRDLIPVASGRTITLTLLLSNGVVPAP